MEISLLQLNINADNFWDKLIPYLTNNDFDILQLQEVCGKGTVSGNLHCQRDCYTELQKILDEKYQGELAVAQRYTSNPLSYIGSATFYKKNFKLIKKHILTLYERTTPFPSELNHFEDAGRNLLHLTLEKNGKIFSLLNTHCAWAKTPQEEPFQTQQGEILIKYLKRLPSPFVLSGDFNLDPQQPTIQKINSLTRNLCAENQVTNTLNPRTHMIKDKLQNGLEIAVDYIFVSNDIEVKNFAVVEEDISDHLGLITKIELE